MIKELLLDKDSSSDTRLVFDKLQQQINDTVQRAETSTYQQQGDLMNQRLVLFNFLRFVVFKRMKYSYYISEKTIFLIDYVVKKNNF